MAQFGESLTPQIDALAGVVSPASVNHATPKWVPGARTLWKGEYYRYVKHSTGTGTVAAAAGDPAYWKTIDPDADVAVFVVTPDESDSLYGINGVAGVYLGVPTDTYYCFIKISGERIVNTSGSMAVGDKIIGSVTDHQFGRIAAGGTVTDVVYGVAKSGTSSIAATVLLMNLDW